MARAAAARSATLTIEGMPLVTVPVGLVNARKRAADVSLSIVFPDGRQAKTIYKNPVTGEIVESRPATRGVKVGKDDKGDVFGLVDVEAWEKLNSETKLHVLGFTTREELMERVERVVEAHYLVPAKGTDPSGLGMILRGMEGKDACAVVKFAVGRKERLGAIVVQSDGAMVVLTLQFAESMAEKDERVMAAVNADVSENAIAQVEALIETTTLEASTLDDLVDETLAERRKIVEAAAKGEAPIPVKADEPSGSTTDLAGALEASLAALKAKA